MIFQYTIQSVLSKNKTQTSRIWHPSWVSQLDSNGNLCAVKTQTRVMYKVNQILSCQPARGQKGIAKIRVLSLARRDVRNFDAGDIQREGFKIPFDFYEVWCDMHDAPFVKTLDAESLAGNWITPLWKRPSELYQALVIRFELLDASPK